MFLAQYAVAGERFLDQGPNCRFGKLVARGDRIVVLAALVDNGKAGAETRQGLSFRRIGEPVEKFECPVWRLRTCLPKTGTGFGIKACVKTRI